MASSSGALKAAGAPKRVLQLWVHDMQTSQEDILLNQDTFPNLKVGDLLELYPADRPEETKRLILMVGATSLEKKPQMSAQMQVSLRRDIADLMQLPVRKEMLVRPSPERKAVSLDFVEIAFKDQYVSGSEMWQLKCALVNTCVFTQKKLQFGSSRAQVRELLHGGQLVQSGLITDSTKLVFRSRSAKFVVLLQMSREMWEFAQDGHIYFEKAVSGFLQVLTDRWKSIGVAHSLSVLFFARMYLPAHSIALHASAPAVSSSPTAAPSSNFSPYSVSEKLSLHRERKPHTGFDDRSGRAYEDVYKPLLLDDCACSWDQLPVLLKKEFFLFAQQLHEIASDGENSTASTGNFLEAINLTMNLLENAHVERDLSRTNHNIVCISPGKGIFEVDRDLAQLTKRRMVDSGMGCDLICLAPAPLHLVPLFRHKDTHSIPHWVFISFFLSAGSEEDSSAPSQWLPSCVIPPEILKSSFPRSDPRSRAVTLIPAAPNTVLVPRLKQKGAAGYAANLAQFHATFDEGVFGNLSGIVASPAPPSLVNFKSMTSTIALSGLPSTQSVASVTASIRKSPTSSSDALPTLAAAPSLLASTLSPSSPPANITMSSTNLSSAPNGSAVATRNHSASISAAAATAPTSAQKRASVRVPPLTLSGTSVSTTAASSAATATTASGPALRLSGQNVPTAAALLSPTSSTVSATSGTESSTVPNLILSPSAIDARTSANSSSGTGASSSRAALKSSTGAVMKTTLSPQQSSATSAQSTAPVSSKLRVDPFLHEVPPPGPSSMRRRWAHLCPPNLAKHEPNWKSLIEPACLPVTTNYFPPSTELNTLYKQSVFQLSLIPDENTYQNRTDELLRELISQRLDLGYQLVVQIDTPPQAAGSRATTRVHTNPSSVAGNLMSLKIPKRLSLGRTYHQLTYDDDAQNIQVLRYYRDAKSEKGAAGGKKKPSSMNFGSTDSLAAMAHSTSGSGPTSREGSTNSLGEVARLAAHLHQPPGYHYKLCQSPQLPRGTAIFDMTLPHGLQHDHISAYNWNFHDELICGYNSHLTPSVRYNRIRMVVMPIASKLLNGSVSDEERDQRAVQFDKFREFLREKCIATPALPKLNVFVPLPPPKPLPKTAGTLKLTMGLPEVANAMKDAQTGLPLKDRKHMLRNFEKTFTGPELIEWLMKNVDGARVKEEAMQAAQRLMDARLIRHLDSKATVFADATTNVYRFRKSPEESARAKERRGNKVSNWFSMVTTAIGQPPPPTPPPGATGSSNTSTPAPAGSAPPPVIIASPIPTNVSSGAVITATSDATPAPATNAQPPAIKLAASGVLANEGTAVATATTNSTTAATSDSTAPAPATPGGIPAKPASFKRVDQSHRVTKIQLKDPKGERYQWMFLTYEPLFESDLAYSLEFQWVTCTAPLVEEFILLCQRKAKGWGLALVQVPTESSVIADENSPFPFPLWHPFKRPVYIKLPAQLQTLPPEERLTWQLSLLAKCDFMYLLPARPVNDAGQAPARPLWDAALPKNWRMFKYLHKSAVAMITLTLDGFLWETNDLVSSGRQIGSEKLQLPNVTALFNNFYDLCISFERLDQLLHPAQRVISKSSEEFKRSETPRRGSPMRSSDPAPSKTPIDNVGTSAPPVDA